VTVDDIPFALCQDKKKANSPQKSGEFFYAFKNAPTIFFDKKLAFYIKIWYNVIEGYF